MKKSTKVFMLSIILIIISWILMAYAIKDVIPLWYGFTLFVIGMILYIGSIAYMNAKPWE